MIGPTIQVGILTGKQIPFYFTGAYKENNLAQSFTGQYTVTWHNGEILFNDCYYRQLEFIPEVADAFFTLPQVTIGIDFHWERTEKQSFKGSLKLLATSTGVTLINEIPVEEYLTSVISSEMSATAGKEFLKAHAVISRSWLLAQLHKNKKIREKKETYNSRFITDREIIRWYDREDHDLFDVCADDHCQRYQGITRASLPIVQEVIRETAGQVLYYQNTICDARFSKCCGGVSEQFEYCWEPESHPYLMAVRDGGDNKIPSLTEETIATEWITQSPPAFCNTNDTNILGQVLNNYDQETNDFYRWKITYTADCLSELIHRKSGIDFGEIQDICPVKRGVSGRLEKIKITGSKHTCTIGKELEIRRILSETHLYSSAFVVKKEISPIDATINFVFTGAGWGHGVGLCQIGAAVMGEKGYNYKEILAHYFTGAEVTKLY